MTGVGPGETIATGADTRFGNGVMSGLGAVPLPETGKTAAHTLQRARTPAVGTLAGSTRYVVAQVGQTTFIQRPSVLSDGGAGSSSEAPAP